MCAVHVYMYMYIYKYAFSPEEDFALDPEIGTFMDISYC